MASQFPYRLAISRVALRPIDSLREIAGIFTEHQIRYCIMPNNGVVIVILG